MKFNHTFCFVALLLFCGCARKSQQVPAFQKESEGTFNGYWKEVNEQNKSALNCQGRVLPLRYRIFEVDYPALRKLLLRKGASAGALNLDTILISVPIPIGNPEEYAITQIQVLPPELSDKYPDIKTYHGKSLIYPEDIIRLDIAPKGISVMIMSTRGTIMIDPFCNNDSLHVICYFKKDLPEGQKEDFEK